MRPCVDVPSLLYTSGVAPKMQHSILSGVGTSQDKLVIHPWSEDKIYNKALKHMGFRYPPGNDLKSHTPVDYSIHSVANVSNTSAHTTTAKCLPYVVVLKRCLRGNDECDSSASLRREGTR